jgi:hypothetical protein
MKGARNTNESNSAMIACRDTRLAREGPFQQLEFVCLFGHCRAWVTTRAHKRQPHQCARRRPADIPNPLKERILREVGYGLSLEGASAADLVKSIQTKTEPV